MDDLMRLLQLAGVTGLDKAQYTEYVEEKKADKDYDEDGEIEDTDDEWKGSRDNAIKDEKCDESAEEELEEEEEVIDEEEELEEDDEELQEMRRMAGLGEAPEWGDHFDNDREAGGDEGGDAMDFAVSMDDPAADAVYGHDMDSFAASDDTMSSSGSSMSFTNTADAIEAQGELEAYGFNVTAGNSGEGKLRLYIDAPQDVLNDIAQKWEGATVEDCGGIDDTQPSMGGPMGGGEEPEMVVIQLDGPEDMMMGEGMGDLDLIAQDIANELSHMLQSEPEADPYTAVQELVKYNSEIPDEMKAQVAEIAYEYYEGGMEEGCMGEAGEEGWGPDDVGYVDQPEADGGELGAFDPAELISQITMLQDSGMSAANAMYDPERMLQMPIDQIVSIHKKVTGGQVEEEDDNWGGDPGYQTDQPGGHVPYDADDLFPSGQATNAIHRVSNTAGGHSDNPMATVDPITRESTDYETDPVYNKLKENWGTFSKVNEYGEGGRDNDWGSQSRQNFKRREMDKELGHEKNGPPIKMAIKVPFNDKDTVKNAARQAGVRLGWHKGQKTWYVQVPPTQDVLGAISKLEKASGIKLR